jgi:uncharacterized protein YndB with AHSA1/START domain
MPTARATRTITSSPEQLWGILSDPYHLPRWWPRVERVEDVSGAAFTEVMRTRSGKTIRADFELLQSDEQSGTVVWEQVLEGTPFAGVLSMSETELRVSAAHAAAPAGLGGSGASASEVTIEMRQELSNRPAHSVSGAARSWSGVPAPASRKMPSFGGWMLRRAASRMINEALDGLERICG